MIIFYSVHESLYILLGNDDSITWSTLSYLSRVAILRKALDRIKCQVAYKINRPLSNDSSISPCVYSWPWVALRKDSRLHLHNVQTQELIRLRSGNFKEVVNHYWQILENSARKFSEILVFRLIYVRRFYWKTYPIFF